MKNKKFKVFALFLIIFGILLFINEFLIYYLTLSQCNWPETNENNNNNEHETLKAMILADTHLLGPFQGHWFDKLRREWQMHRAFQTAITLFRPEVIFILGDLFDEGHWVNPNQFQEYVDRFHKLFHTPQGVDLISIVGNHDIGFHYRMYPSLVQRFDNNFNNTGVVRHTIKNVHFITINSMAMENDKCIFCESAKHEIMEISSILNCAKTPSTCTSENKRDIVYSQPIIMQHFPMYRKSDEDCLEHDSPVIEDYRENWEVLSKQATDYIGKHLNPRVAFSGHSHHFCRLKNRLNIEEFTISSFSWRNKNRPSFILAHFAPSKYSTSICYVPQETTVLQIYFYSIAIMVILFVFSFFRRNMKMNITKVK